MLDSMLLERRKLVPQFGGVTGFSDLQYHRQNRLLCRGDNAQLFLSAIADCLVIHIIVNNIQYASLII